MPILNRQVYYRLMALWVVCEALLGGIIHGLKLPVSGLVVGGCAVICISLIAFYVPEKGAVLKATIVVAVFKMMLSPHSPPAAYLAVLFQGLMGELLFMNRKYFRLSCLLLGVVALFESGIQRIVVLTVLYGTDFWKAVNEFIRGITREETVTNYSLYLAGGYVLLHIMTGAFIGWTAGMIPRKIKGWRKEMGSGEGLQIFHSGAGSGNSPIALQKPNVNKGRRRTGLLIVWILLLLLTIQSELKIGEPLLSSQLAVRIFVRSVLVVLTWYFLFAPFLLWLLKRWLEKQKSKSQNTIQEIVRLLPSMQQLVEQSWKRAQEKKGWKRLNDFIKNVLASALYDLVRIYILSGPVQSGKTTWLQNWAAGRNDTFGILTPVIDGKRVFMNVTTKETLSMEADETETKIITVGKYRFSDAAFQHAKKILQDALNEKSGWVVMDEIGPLELEGKGFSEEIHALLKNNNEELKFVLVIRESILERAVQHFGMDGQYQLLIR